VNNFSRFASLLACGCVATAVACGGDSDGGAASAGGAGADGTGGTAGADGGAGGAGGLADGVAQICPELVEADCPARSAYLPSEATCSAGLPTLALACPTEIDDLYACTGPDPEITCDSTTGAPTSEGCEAEWGGVMSCVAALMSQGTGGASGAGGAGG
jgi:hypothetical protein